jgi:hypothetical protein
VLANWDGTQVPAAEQITKVRVEIGVREVCGSEDEGAG